MASIIEGFLVKLGFDVDKEGTAKFKGAIEAAEKRARSLAKHGAAIGTAFVAGTLKATNSLAKLHDYTRINRASIEGVNALGIAFKSVGGSTEEAMSAVSALSMNIKRFPNFGKILENRYGVKVFDRFGKQRDTVAILMDLRKELQKMPEAVGRVHAEFLGLGEAYDHLMSPEFGKQFAIAAGQTRAWGRSLTDGSKAARQLQTQVEGLGNNLTNGLLVAVGKFTQETGLDSFLKRINEKFPKTASAVIEAEARMMKESSGFFDWLDKWLFQSDLYLAKVKVAMGTATDADKQLIENFNKKEKAFEIAKGEVNNGGTLTENGDSATIYVDVRKDEKPQPDEGEVFVPQEATPEQPTFDGVPKSQPVDIKVDTEQPASVVADQKPVQVSVKRDPIDVQAVADALQPQVVVVPVPGTEQKQEKTETTKGESADAAQSSITVVCETQPKQPVWIEPKSKYPDVEKWLEAGLPKPKTATTTQQKKEKPETLSVMVDVPRVNADAIPTPQPSIALNDLTFSPQRAKTEAAQKLPERSQQTSITNNVSVTVNAPGVTRETADRIGRVAGQSAVQGVYTALGRSACRDSVRNGR